MFTFCNWLQGFTCKLRFAQILAKKAFKENWFNNTPNLNISEADLTELLRVATKGQLFQYSDLYEQIDGVAMGSPLGLIPIEEKLEHESKLPPFYRRYVDDTFALVRDSSAADSFLSYNSQ